jgi:hypothetical protein
LWDIVWLTKRNSTLSGDLIKKKLADRKIPVSDFLSKYRRRLKEIKDGQTIFLQEMRRFLAPSAFNEELLSPLWWEYLLSLLNDLENHALS